MGAVEAIVELLPVDQGSRHTDNLPYEKCGDEVRCIAEEVPFDIPAKAHYISMVSGCSCVDLLLVCRLKLSLIYLSNRLILAYRSIVFI